MSNVLGQTLAGRYEIREEIGRGGMATVYSATDLQTSGIVAVKVMRDDLAQSLSGGRFTREMQITTQLRHPGIVPLLDAGEVNGIPFYTMPYIDGETLAQRLLREKQLGIETALGIMHEVLDALAHAHNAGVLHRDIKPANILLSGGRALIADFGIARVLGLGGDRLTDTGIAVGTSEYMSPEQGSADAVDQRSDLYSLGCVFYEMLSGAPPFTGPSAQAVIARHARDPMPSLRTVRSTVTRRLEAIVAKCLEKVPADRFASAQELNDALRDPAVLGPETSFIDTPPRSRRWAWAIGSAVVCAALALVVTRREMTPTLDPHRLVGFPLVAPATVGASQAAGEDMATLIGSAIDRRAALRWVDGWRSLDAIDRDAAGGPSSKTMARIARDAGAGWYLTGRIVVRGDSADVLLELVDAANDSVAVRPRATGPTADLWRVAIRAVNQVLPVLVPGTDAKDLESAWADRDPGAVADFLAGEAAFRRARPREALAHFRDAVHADSQFALAAVRGAQAATADHRPGEARVLVERARLMAMPAQYVEFTRGYVAFLDGRADSAITAFRRAIAIDRELTAAWIQLGETYIHLVTADSSADALADAAFSEARALDSTATHVLLHPIEIAWRRGDRSAATPMVQRFLATNPDSEQAASVRVVDACGRSGARGVDWTREVRANAQAMISVGVVMAAHGAQLSCALGAYDAALTVDSTGQLADGDSPQAIRQAALIGAVATWSAAGRPDSARARIEASAARGDGGLSLFLLGATVEPSFARDAALVAARDSARFGSDLAGCTSNERCWLLGVYHSTLGHAVQAETVARVLASRVAADTTGVTRVYAEAAHAHALVAAGDSAAARTALRALLRTPFPLGELLTWGPIGGFGFERLTLARLLVAHGELAEAIAVANGLDAAPAAMFPLYLRASLELRASAESALGHSREATALKARLSQLSMMRVSAGLR